MDISMRLEKDVLVMSSELKTALKRYDIDTDQDLTIANILEEDTIHNAFSLEVAAGADCLIANTKDLIQARLAQEKLDGRLEEIASAALRTVNKLTPQHVLVELGWTGLPLDGMSRNSLNENKNQYVASARVFEKLARSQKTAFDAYFLTGFENTLQLKCALMGLRQVTDKPIFACMQADAEGKINPDETIYDAASVMSEFGASVAVVSTSQNAEGAFALCKRIRAACDLPIMVEFLCVPGEEPYAMPESMVAASAKARLAGASFFRAAREATPAYTAVLSACAQELKKATECRN